jgi:DNA polymerase (family 10)
MQNAEIADAFAELADRLALTDEKPFRYMAYRKADTTFRELGASVAVLSREGRLREIEGIGPAIEEKVEQLLATGTFPALERAREEVDDTLLELTRLPGIGPATARKVYAAVDGEGFNSLLERAAAGTLPVGDGITKKVVDALAAEAARRASGTSAADGSHSGIPRDDSGEPLPGPWFRRDQAAAQADALTALANDAAAPGATQVLGDYARGCELVPGLDLLVDCADPEPVRTALVAALDSRGFSVVSVANEPLAVVTPAGMPASITVAPATDDLRSTLAGPPAWTAAFAGDPAADTVPWEVRDGVLAGTWDLDSAPRELVRAADLRGELHGHSDWSDGRATIIEMARAARDRGDSYYLVSDHSAPYAMVGGLDEDRLLAQADEIAAANEQLRREHEVDGAPAFRLLHGSEVEILADGTLGLPDRALARLDWVVASIHVAQRQQPDAILQRMARVLANPLVDSIGHPTSRRLLRRERTALDIHALIELAAATGVVLEVNANPDRLDLDSHHARLALDAGIQLAVNCDAHRPANLDLRSHGIAVARRAGATRADVINTRSADELLEHRRRDRE